MNKIICDICGTVFPDNAEACPICGYPRQENEKTASETQSAAVDTEQASRTAARTRGGHYSSKNVKKRMKAQSGESGKSGGGWKAVLLILLAAVIGLGVYIGYRFWNGRQQGGETTTGTMETSTAPSETTQPTDTVSLACTDLELGDEMVELNSEIPTWLLTVTTEPENTTDEVTFASSDETVVTVDADGRLTAVADGSAIITVSCGTITRECLVTCTLEAETEPSETTQPTETSEPEEAKLELSHTDVTLFSEGESFTINVTYGGAAVSLASVTWTTSNEEIAVVNNGKVTAAGPGTATITAEYEGVKQTCVVRCSYKDEDDTEPTETTGDNGSDSNTSVAGQVINPDEEGVRDHNWTPNKTDVTITVGETFTLRLTNDAGQIASVKWSVGNSAIASMDRFTVVGVAPGVTTLTVTINSTTYSCVVRVK